MPSILVVDDEELIRALVQRVLERRGYTVVACETGADALGHAGPIDVALVDLILPDMDGVELTDALRARTPGLPVVLMSGYMSCDVQMPGPPASFLQKPMLPAEVIEAVEKVLGQTEAP